MTDKEDVLTHCSYCTGAMNSENGPRCKSCGAFHHKDCWIEFEGCVSYGCAENPDMKKFQAEKDSDLAQS